MINYKVGNILYCTEDIICQQVNHQGVMRAGLANQIANKYPDIVKGYRRFCKTYPFEKIKDCGLVNFFEGDKLIANIFGQEYYGRDERYTDYEALTSGLETVWRVAVYDLLSIAIPYKIGCGLGGGDWNIVEGIIRNCFFDYEVTIYKLPKQVIIA